MIRRLLLVSAAVVAVVASAPTAAQPADLLRERAITVLEANHAALNRGDMAGAMAAYAAEPLFEGGMCRPACRGRAAVEREIARQIGQGFRVVLDPASVQVQPRPDGTLEVNATVEVSIVQQGVRAPGVLNRITSIVAGDRIAALCANICHTPVSGTNLALWQTWLAARDRGDVAAAVALLTDDVYLETAEGPCAAGCFGKPDVYQELVAQVADRTTARLDLNTVRDSGQGLTGQVEESSDSFRAAGRADVATSYAVQIRGDRIAAICIASCRSATPAGGVPTAPAVVAEAQPGVGAVPEAAGSGGYPVGRNATRWVAAGLLAGLLVLVASAAVDLYRRRRSGRPA